MTGFTDYWARKVLDHTTGKTSIGSLPTVYVALYTVIGDDSGGFTEPSGFGYARFVTSGATWNAASGSAPSSVTNAAAIQFPTATGSWGQIVGFGLHDDPTSGNRLAFDYLGNYPWMPIFAQVGSPSPILAKAHGLPVGAFVAYSTEYVGTPPSFGRGDFTGLLTVTSTSPDVFTVSNSGTPVDVSVMGSGLMRRVLPQTIDGSIVNLMVFDVGQLTISA